MEFQSTIVSSENGIYIYFFYHYYIDRHPGSQEKTVKTKQSQCSTPSHMVVMIYYCMGYKYKATTWYLTGFPNGSNLGSTV